MYFIFVVIFNLSRCEGKLCALSVSGVTFDYNECFWRGC